MLGSSLPPVVCMGFVSFLRFVCVFAYSGVEHILCCGFFSVFFWCFVYPILSVSLDYPLFIAPSVFSDVYLTVL